MATRLYEGYRKAGRTTVRVMGEVGWHDLPPRPDLLQDLPILYGWAISSACSERLAVALLADALGSDQLACAWASAYARHVVSKWDQEAWLTTRHEIVQWVVDAAVREVLDRR